MAFGDGHNPSVGTLTGLLAKIAREPSSDGALEEVAQAALDVTGGRHVLVAVLNEEVGKLEIRTSRWREAVPGNEATPNMDASAGAVGHAATTGSAVLSDSGGGEFGHAKLFPDSAGEVAVPVFDRSGRVSGVLHVESDQPFALDDEAHEFVGALSDLVAIVLEREAHHQREEALMRVGAAIASVVTEAALIDQVMRVAAEVLRLQACSIFLIEPHSDRFVLRGTSGRLREWVDHIAYRRGEGFTGWVCDTGLPILLDNPMSDPRWRGKHVEFPSEQVASFLAVPIVSRGTSVGAIRALRRKSDNPLFDNRFRPDDMRLLSAIAEQLAIGLESVRNTERAIRSERMVAWGELSAKSSHMIGNRVFALKGDLNELDHVLAGEAPSLSDLRELNASLGVNVRRIEEILQDFRDFVSATQLTRLPSNLNAVIRETVGEVFPRRSEIVLAVELDAAMPVFGFDAKRLRRALSELIENSLVHMTAGTLSVRSRLVAGADNERTLGSKAARFAQIEIADTGPGIEPERKNLIFQPFYSGRVRGMGLGLSIVKGIVDAHGGLVYEAGALGTGARFVILLPIEE